MWSKDGRQREMGLGSAKDVSLARARDLAAEHRRTLQEGGDPLEARKACTTKPTFGIFAEAHIASMESGWQNPKHRQQWRNTLTTYAGSLKSVRVDEITTAQVLAALKPIWSTKPETASRVRGRIEAVLDAAKAAGHRTGDNPASWRGHLDHILPKRTKLSRGHHAAMPIDDLPAFAPLLRQTKSVSARALEFTILTAARTGETLDARWSEMDRNRKVWTVPAARMKGGREHRVPLCDRAVEILGEMDRIRCSEFVFPGSKRDAGLSNMALDMALLRLGQEVTVHGFRSTFRDWAGERTNFSHEVAEMALAHAIPSKTEAAYRRGDLFEKRRKLMEAWSTFVQAAAHTTAGLIAIPAAEHPNGR